MRLNLQIKGLSFLAVLTLLLSIGSFFIPGIPHRASAGLLIWSGIQSMAAYYGFSWSILRLDNAVYMVFLGDALLRLVVLGAAAAVLQLTRTPIAVPLLSLAAGYLILSIAQIPFLHQIPL